jgi:hypothetical protein
MPQRRPHITDPVRRRCLECRRWFTAEGRYHRFCPNCGPHKKENRRDALPQGRVRLGANRRDADRARRERVGEGGID